MPEKYALVEYSSATNNTIRNIFQTTQRIRFTAFDVSSKFIVFGTNSGGIYIFTREPCQFLKLIPSTHGPTNLLSISPNEENLAVAVSTGLVIILENCFMTLFEQQVFMEHEGHTVTAMKWNNNDLYCGDSIGRVSVITLQNFLTKAMFHAPAACLMHLESKIVQLDTHSKFLLVSTQTRSLLCDIESEKYRQIGKKMRDGPFGACFLHGGGVQETGDSFVRSRGAFKTVSDGNDLSATVNEGRVKIYCARPGVRLWQADFQANVVVTHQFRPSLPREQSDIIQWDDCDGLKIKSFDGGGLGENFNFGRVYAFCDKFILSFRDDGFYIFEPSCSALLYWSAHLRNIKDIKIVDNYLYIWHNDLDVSLLSLLAIEELILRSLMRKKYTLCAELCIEFFEDVEALLPTSKKLYLISALESKSIDSTVLTKLEPIFRRLKEYRKTPSLEKYKNGIVTVNAPPVLPESVQNFQIEKGTKKPSNILLEQFKINKIEKTIETTDFAQLMQSSNSRDLYKMFTDFGSEINDHSWCKEMYLKHLNLCDDLNSQALNYASEAFLEINHCANLVCKCDFPLPSAKQGVPKYLETGCKLMEKTDNYEMFLQKVPYLHKHLLTKLIPKDIQLKIALIIQFSDPEIIEIHANKFSYDLWDESVRLLLKLKGNQCLNCGTNIDSTGNFQWTTFGLLMIQSIKATNAIKLLKRYSNLLPRGELDQFFYQYCVLSAVTNLNSNNLGKALDGDENVKKQFEAAVGGYLRKKYLRGGEYFDGDKSTGCDHCHLPSTTPIIGDMKRLICGHNYHQVCFLYNKNRCFVCNPSL